MMDVDVVVWNLDAQNRPELEVEIVLADDTVDHIVDGDSWFIDDGTPIEEMPLIHSVPPNGYSSAYRLSAWREAG